MRVTVIECSKKQAIETVDNNYIHRKKKQKPGKEIER